MLDMRSNGGGLLQGAVQVSNLFMPPGKIVVRKLTLLTFILICFNAPFHNDFRFLWSTKTGAPMPSRRSLTV